MLRSSLGLALINVIASASSYLLTIYLMKVFSLDVFGYYNHILLLASFYSILIVYATDQTTTRNFFHSQRDKRILLEVLYFRLLVFSVGIAVVYFIYDFMFVIGFIAFCLPSLSLSYGYEVKARHFKYALVFLIERFVYASSVLIIFHIFSPSVYYLFLILVVVSISSILYQIYDLNISLKIKFFSIISSVRILKDNSNVMFATLALFVYGGFSRLILEHHSGYATLALYSAAWQFVMLATLFQTQVERIFRPKLSTIDFSKKSFSSISKLYFTNAFLPMFFISVMTFFLGAELFVSFVGEKYSNSKVLIQIFSFYFIVVSADSFVRMLYLRLNLDTTYRNIQIFFALTLLIVILFFGDIQVEYFAFLVCACHGLATVTSLIFIIYSNRKTLNET